LTPYCDNNILIFVENNSSVSRGIEQSHKLIEKERDKAMRVMIDMAQK